MTNKRSTPKRYTHACDASAAALLADRRHFVAASDEDNVLRVYDLESSGAPVTSVDVTSFLDPEDPGDEADIEGVARVGDRLYWIGSHGLNKRGKVKELRRRLFATSIAHDNGGLAVVPVGRPYKTLLQDMVSAASLKEFDLETAASKAPEADGGLNVEGLAPTPDGKLLIGFRNPVPGGRALVIQLANADQLVEGGAQRAELSVAGRLDLQNRGIRALEYVARLNQYLILAGPFNDIGTFALYSWSGRASDPAHLVDIDVAGLQPEELITTVDDDGRLMVHLLSDDGSDECKQAPIDQKGFRVAAVALTLER